MIPSKRQPTHPGEILLEEFLKPKGMSQVELAQKVLARMVSSQAGQIFDTYFL